MTRKVKRLTIQDATKEELISYFFMPECFGGGNTLPARKDSFLSWLYRRRQETLNEQAYEARSQSLDKTQEASSLFRRAAEAEDMAEKESLITRAAEAGRESRRLWDKGNILDKRAEHLYQAYKATFSDTQEGENYES